MCKTPATCGTKQAHLPPVITVVSHVEEKGRARHTLAQLLRMRDSGGMELKEEGSQLQASEKAFRLADEEGKGYLTKEDYKAAVISLFGYKPSNYEVEEVWNKHCPNSSVGLVKKGFIDLMTSRLKSQDTDDLIRQIFVSFDRQSRGFISLQDCKDAFRQITPHIGERRIETVFGEVDSNMDGRVSYRDFEIMVKHMKQ